jgi:prepilin-type N-terminal cleavage/methylation domain-containing protein
MTKWVQRHSQQRAAGFTLIEVLIVIVILAILGAVVVFAVQDMSKSTAAATCKSDYKAVENAAELFKAQVGDYPGGSGYFEGASVTPHAAVAGTANSSGILALLGTASVGGGVVGPWLKDYPQNGLHYQLELSSAGVIGVYTSGAAPVQIGSTNSESDCASVG